MTTTLHRKMDDKMLAGVCSAIAAQTNLDLNTLRLAVAAVSVLGGVIGIGLAVPALYVLAWILLPADDTDLSPAQRWLNKNRPQNPSGPTGPTGEDPIDLGKGL